MWFLPTRGKRCYTGEDEDRVHDDRQEAEFPSTEWNTIGCGYLQLISHRRQTVKVLHVELRNGASLHRTLLLFIQLKNKARKADATITKKSVILIQNCLLSIDRISILSIAHNFILQIHLRRIRSIL